MAVTAKFQANFDSFLTAVQKADDALVDFGKGAGQVQTKLNTFADQFSGRKVIQEASLMAAAIQDIGGFSKLSADQIDRVAKTADEAAAAMKRLGVDGADQMQRFAEEVKAAGKSMDDSFGKIDIKGAIQNPMAAAEHAVEAFGESLGAAGVAAAGFGLGIVAVGAALVGLTVKAADVGGKLNDVSEVTGISVPQLSRLSNAATVAGTDLQTMSNAVFMMQKNLAENPDKFQKGLERLNIDLQDFQSLTPDHQLLAIAGALKATEDPVERNAAGFELMGRQFRDLAPALFKMNEALEATADIQPFTDEEARKAEAFEMQLSSLRVHIEAVGTSIGRTLIPVVSELIGTLTSAASATVNFAGGFGGALSPVGAAKSVFGYAQAALEAYGITATETAKGVDKLAEKQDHLNKVFDDAHTPDADVKRWKDAAAGLALTMADVNAKVAGQEAVIKSLDEETKAHIKSETKAAEEAQKFKDVWTGLNSLGKDWHETLLGINPVVLDSATFYAKAGASAEQLAKGFGLTAEQAKAVKSSVDDFAKTLKEVQKIENDFDENKGIGELAKMGEKSNLAGFDKVIGKVHEIEDGFFGIGTAIDKVGLHIKPAMADLDNIPKSFLANFETAAAKIPDIFVQAFTGGGGLSGAIKGIGSVISGALGSTLFGAFKDNQVKGGLFNGLTGLFASLVPAIGPAIGALAGPLISGLTSLFTGGAEHVINPIREAFVQAAGGLDALNQKAHAAGVTLNALLNAKDQEQYAKAVDDLNAAFAAQKAKVDADSSSLLDLLKTAQTFGSVLPQGIQDGIQKLIDMGKVTGDVTSVFADMANAQKVSFNTLSDIAKKYGADLNNLGPKFEAAKISDTANQIINDFDTLERGIGDTDEALTIMKKPINDLVNQSIKFGVDIPKNMQPWIEQLEKTGQLVDENGDAITDLSKIKFGDAIKTQFQVLIDKLQELIDKISGNGGITDALNGIPKKVTTEIVTIHTDEGGGAGDNSPSYAARGGYVTTGGVQYLAGGGRVLAWPSRGSDTVPAMLTPGEGVVSKRGMASIGKSGLAAINRGGGFGGDSVVIHNSFTIAADVDSPATRERFRKAVDDATMQALRRQKRTQVA